MHKLPLVAILCLALPGVAHAGFVLEGSLGRGAQVRPTLDSKIGRTNIMIAPGWGLGEMLRAELGIVGDLAQDNSAGKQDFNLRLRPMLVIDPPVLPLYFRIITGVTNLLEDSRHFEFGGAAGVSASVGGLGVFGELGLLPQSIGDSFVWILEGRAGAQLFF